MLHGLDPVTQCVSGQFYFYRLKSKDVYIIILYIYYIDEMK